MLSVQNSTAFHELSRKMAVLEEEEVDQPLREVQQNCALQLSRTSNVIEDKNNNNNNNNNNKEDKKLKSRTAKEAAQILLSTSVASSKQMMTKLNSKKRLASVKFDSLNSAPKEQLNRAKPSGDIHQSEESASRLNKRRSTPNEVRKDQEEAERKLGEAGQPSGGGAGAGDGEQPKGKDEEESEPIVEDNKDEQPFEAPLVWRNIILFVILHSAIPVGIRMLWKGQVSGLTLVWMMIGVYISGLGVTGGAHRLWSHRSYKASWPVQTLLMALQTMAGQNSIYIWSRDHRVHHKYSETNGDPHNIKRGFFFAHMGWLCCRKHPDVKTKGAAIDMSDLRANPVVMFQHRHFWWLSVLFNVLLPSYLPKLLWGEDFWVGFTFAFMLRYLITLHGTWCVNSAAHYFGSRPYDGRIEARESPFVIAQGLGEGFHNYHHTFPYDYSTSEFGKYFNITTAFIDSCAALGLVTERRSMSAEMIEKRQLRTGDGTGSYAKRLEGDTQQANGAPSSGGMVNNLIHELPYISGLTSMKYTM